MKKCSKCHEEKPNTAELFYRDKTKRDGLRNDCKECKDSKRDKWFKQQGPEYGVWQTMKNRCNNKTVKSYEGYGGRGISVSDRWLNSFESFIEDLGRRPSDNHTLERLDNEGNYEKDNCVWATSTEQARNRRVRATSVSGVTGVNWKKDRSKWHAGITVNYKVINLGYYDNKKEAIDARKIGELKYWDEPNTL